MLVIVILSVLFAVLPFYYKIVVEAENNSVILIRLGIFFLSIYRSNVHVKSEWRGSRDEN